MDRSTNMGLTQALAEARAEGEAAGYARAMAEVVGDLRAWAARIDAPGWQGTVMRTLLEEAARHYERGERVPKEATDVPPRRP